jgi:hypothetical protein
MTAIRVRVVARRGQFAAPRAGHLGGCIILSEVRSVPRWRGASDESVPTVVAALLAATVTAHHA